MCRMKEMLDVSFIMSLINNKYNILYCLKEKKPQTKSQQVNKTKPV